MFSIARLALLMVVFIDVMGQGLIFPILTTLLLREDSAFLMEGNDLLGREATFGVVLGVFYLFWFFGAAYISKLSDYIGRKNGILICLTGALVGYVLTVLAIYLNSLILLIVGRAVAGFTAGNQPIAQASLIDQSRSPQEKSLNLGLITAFVALGLVVGPLLAGGLSDSRLLGSYASLQLPFMAAIVLVLINIFLIYQGFEETNKRRKKIDFGPSEVFLVLWRVRGRPTIVKLCLVFFFVEMGLNAFYIYLNNFQVERFGFSTQQTSLTLVVFGLVMAFSSIVLVRTMTQFYQRLAIVKVCTGIMAVFVLAYAANSLPLLSYILLVPVVAAFGLAYPIMLSLFSASARDDEQGWVMGVTMALFTLGAGIISLGGGFLMALDVKSVFFVGVLSFIIALVLQFGLWREPDVEALDPPIG
ncbi:MFS transporter [Pseudovibrio sp. SPO723]|uniref:MFS transporter n=1 Tax=Nesiotobacter zosterae TaxID=392721 RepID=UPI0029C49F86|nr:MFS transporter [Pseudovibrio sp. SPO723]MDX5594594.1 MFS transporter [Pseudovibrio sp. SPO723]